MFIFKFTNALANQIENLSIRRTSLIFGNKTQFVVEFRFNFNLIPRLF